MFRRAPEPEQDGHGGSGDDGDLGDDGVDEGRGRHVVCQVEQAQGGEVAPVGQRRVLGVGRAAGRDQIVRIA